MTDDSQQSTTNPTTLTKPSEREIYVERVFEASPERVFAAYTDPELIPQWWGPRGTTTIVDELDARTGGAWRFIHRDPDGTEIVFRGVFREVTPSERIAYTFEWDGMPGYVSVDDVVFEDLGGRTKLKVTSTFHTEAERDGMLDAGMEKGMNESNERLDELLAA
jgi:uncharacterized protein YndB with AHSA1/START domain